MWMSDDRRLLRAFQVLALASLFCGTLALTRVFYSGRGAYIWLGWNLFLAWVPLGLAVVIAHRHAPGKRSSWPASGALAAAWLAFFPNAPYLVTDLIHLRTRGYVPIWYDAIMVFAFALTGLCLAFLSLWLVHRLVERRFGPWAGWAFVAAIAGLSGFGVYLGRYPRWNSWDVVVRPGELLADVAAHVRDPEPRAFGLTLLMAALFGIAYLMLFALTSLGAAVRASEPAPATDSTRSPSS
jgi:uncharacterized membrane protein